MSTKIYDGLLINTQDIFDFTNKMHDLIEECYQELSKKLIMTEVVSYLAALPDSYDPNLSLILNVEREWVQRQASLTKYDYDHDPLRFVLCFGKTHNGKILGNPFYTCTEYMNTLLSMDEVSSYGYWNNTDPEEGVGDEDWELRESEWESILNTEDSFAHLPQYSLNSSNPFANLTLAFLGGESIDSWLEHQPSPEDRLRQQARRKALNHRMGKKNMFPSEDWLENVDNIENLFSSEDVLKIAQNVDRLPLEVLGVPPEPITRETLVFENLKQDEVNGYVDFNSIIQKLGDKGVL